MSPPTKVGESEAELLVQPSFLARLVDRIGLNRPTTQRNIAIGAAALLLFSNVYKSGQNAELRRKAGRGAEPEDDEPSHGVDMDEPGEGYGDEWQPPRGLARNR